VTSPAKLVRPETGKLDIETSDRKEDQKRRPENLPFGRNVEKIPCALVYFCV